MIYIWSVLGVLIAGGFAIYSMIKPKLRANPDQDKRSHLIDFMSNANKFQVDFDKCIFKNSSYISEVEQNGSEFDAANAFLGSPVGLFHTPIEKVENIQSVLFYTDELIQKDKRFVQTFSMDEVTLKYHIMTGHVNLYIDKNDSDQYYFDLVKHS